MTIWFTADTHFGHAGIVGMCGRPYGSVEEMDEALVVNWNRRVRSRDPVWFLGDFALHKNRERLAQVFGRLNGVKNLIRGNHDGKRVMELGWETRADMHMLKTEGRKIVLLHYGMRTWPSLHHGSWHLYGHSHGNLPGVGRSLDVGVDCWNYAPVSIDEISERFATVPDYWPDAAPGRDLV